MNNGTKPIQFSLGALTYPWSIHDIREYYQQIAETAEIQRVYLGEIICSKRAPFMNKYLPELIEIMQNANKEVYIATPILNNNQDTHDLMQHSIKIAQQFNCGVEINDLSALKHVQQMTKVIAGPNISVYNQNSIAVLQRNNVQEICLPYELDKNIIADLVTSTLPVEITVFGNIPLSISSRCFTAHNLGYAREDCKLACFKNSTGVCVSSNEDHLFKINGMQIQSAKIYNLLAYLPELTKIGISSFRINPTPDLELSQIIKLINGHDLEMIERNIFCNGFYHSHEGYSWLN